MRICHPGTEADSKLVAARSKIALVLWAPGLLTLVLCAGLSLTGCGESTEGAAAGCVDEDLDGVLGLSPGCPQGLDCDDADPAVRPGAEEVCGDGIDQDCNGVDAQCVIEGCGDRDADGVLGQTESCPYGRDCDDQNPQVFPGNTEICDDGIDQNCDGEDTPCCFDMDNDGYGEGEACLGPDCNDLDVLVSPVQEEVCGNGKDDDCFNGDEACPALACTEASDTDGDGFAYGMGCYPMDCDDTNPNSFPGAPEVLCDGVDQDCDGLDKCPPLNCIDDDGDGYGVGSECQYSEPDCNDKSPAVNPGMDFDLCGDGVDQDCDGIDPFCPDTQCIDADTDGFHAKSGLCSSGTDCDDASPSINPDAQDFCGDGVDQDCSGSDQKCGVGGFCQQDNDCESVERCDKNAGVCVEFRPWEVWAPVIYLDLSDKRPEWDFFTEFDFDGDGDYTNNAANAAKSSKKAVVYYSLVTTRTHAYLGYHLYFPRRWSTYSVFGTQYDNLMRSALLVIERNPDGSYGDLVLMETTSELKFNQYVPSVSALSNGTASADGVIHSDIEGEGLGPAIFVKNQTHNILGDEDWDTTWFPGGTGSVYRFGGTASETDPDLAEGSYELRSLADTVWRARNKIGKGEPFHSYGRFGGGGTSSRSVAPWRYRDHVEVTKAAGEFLYDPASQVKRHFDSGWGLFSSIYEINPFAVRVDLRELNLYDGGDEVEPDLYLNLFMRGGDGKELKVLSNYGGLLYTWKPLEVQESEKVNLQLVMNRYWYYGLEYPGRALYGVEIKDEDLLFEDWWKFLDDWLMDPDKRHYSSLLGQQLLDFSMTDLRVWVHAP